VPSKKFLILYSNLLKSSQYISLYSRIFFEILVLRVRRYKKNDL